MCSSDLREYPIPAGFATQSVQSAVGVIKQYRKAQISKTERPFLRSNPPSLLKRLSPQMRSSSLPFLPTSPSLMTLISSLLSRITPEGLQPHKPLTSPTHLCPPLSRIEGNQSLMLSSSPPHPSLETPGGSTPLSQSQKMLKKDQKASEELSP